MAADQTDHVAEPAPLGPRAAVLLVASGFLLAFGHLLRGGEVLYRLDLLHYVYPMRELARQCWLNGELPLWNPYVNCGAPLAALGDQSSFGPLSALFLLGPSALVYAWYLLALQGIGAAGVGWLLRGRGRSWTAVGVGMLAFGLNGVLVSKHVNPRFIAGMAWLPWALACHQRALERPVWWLGSAGFLALIILGGCPELAWLAGLLIGGWSLCAPSGAAGLRAKLLRRLRTTLLGPAAVGLLGLGLAAVQTLPLAEYIAASTRAGGAGQASAAWALHPARLAEVIVPGLYGDIADPGGYRGASLLGPGESFPWNATLYAGALVVWLALCAFLGKSRRVPLWERLYYAGASLLCVLLAMSSPLTDLLPGAGQFRFAEKFAVGLALTLPALAACGYDRLREARGRLALGLGLGLAALCVGLPRLGADWIGPDAAVGGLRAGLSVLGALLVLWGAGRVRRVSGLVLLALLALDLGLHGRSQYHSMPAAELPGTPWACAEVQERTADELPPLRIQRLPARTAFPLPAPLRHYTAAAHRFQIESLFMNSCVGSGYRVDGFSPGRLARFRAFFEARPSRALELLSVGWCLSHAEAPPPPAGRLVARQDSTGLRLYAFDGIPPRARLAGRVRWMADEEAVGERLGATDFGLDELALVDPARAGQEDALGGGSCTVRSYRPTEILLEVDSAGPGWLLLSDTWYPGWRAEVDGAPRAVVPGNLLFRALEVPAGKSTVRIFFAPDSLRYGAWLSGLSLALLMALYLLHRLRRRAP